MPYRETLKGLLERAYQSGRDRSKDIAAWEAELACPPLPPELLYLWTAYNRIRRRTGGSGFGLSPIEGADVESYERRYRLRFLPFENEILDELDDLYMAAQAKTMKPTDPAN